MRGNLVSNGPTAKGRFFALLVGMLAFALLVEVGVRTYDAIFREGFFTDHRNLLAREIKPFLIFGFSLYEEVAGVRHISSQHGELFPLAKPNGTYRIVVFGGSTTVNAYSFRINGLHYPLRLQQILKENVATR